MVASRHFGAAYPCRGWRYRACRLPQQHPSHRDHASAWSSIHERCRSAFYKDGTGVTVKADDAVPPGGTYTYLWSVPERSGQASMDGSLVLWMYHSHFVESTYINTRLIGPIIVTRKGFAKPDGSPRDVDREFIADFAVFDETDSWFFEGNQGETSQSGAPEDNGPVASRSKSPLFD